MPGHYKSKSCGCNPSMKGGKLLTPKQIKALMGPVTKFRTMPVLNPRMRQRGMGCGHCGQCGKGFFSDLGSAVTGVFKSPLRAAAAIGTFGASELVAIPADMLKRTTGIKTSAVLDVAAPVIGMVGGPEAAIGSKLTSFGLRQVGLGHKRKKRKKK
jgi:hypothetical protein